MRSIYLLLIVAFAAVQPALADAELFLKINRSGRFTVTIDDNTMSTRNGIFRFYDLNPGTLTLRVTRNEFFNTVVYERPIQLQNGIRTVAEIDYNGNLQIIQQLPFTEQNWYLDQVYSGGGNPNYPNYPQLCPKHQRPGCWHPVPNGPNWDPNCPPNGYPNYPPTGYPQPYPNPGPNPYPCPGFPIGNAMDNTTFQQLKATMKNMPFDDNKLQVAKTALKNSWISTAQVGELMSQFSFDSKKLDFAKFAYDKTTDKQNYFQLYDDFDFNSSATDLDKYIASR